MQNNNFIKRGKVRAEIVHLENRLDVTVEIHSALSGQLNYLANKVEEKRCELVLLECENILPETATVNWQTIEVVQ